MVAPDLRYRSDRNYWMETLASDRAVYIHYSRSQNDDEGVSFDEFGDGVRIPTHADH